MIIEVTPPYFIKLLGRFAVFAPGKVPLELSSQKSKALLAIIALAGANGVERGIVASMLWSRGSDAQARGNLRQTLASIRKSMGEGGDIIISEGSVLSLNREMASVDAEQISQIGFGEQTTGDDIGQLLEGIEIDEPDFAEWLDRQRSEFQNRLASSLFKSAEDALLAGDTASAQNANSKLLLMDEFNEGAHRQAMRILSESAGPGRALVHYESLIELLKSELDVAPSLLTQELAQSLREPNAEFVKSNIVPGTVVPDASKPAEKGNTTVNINSFRNLSVPGDEALGFGIAGDIAAELSRFSTLTVSAVQAENKTQADYHLDGDIRIAGDRFRVSIRLCRSFDGAVVWADRFDQENSDLDAQDELTRKVVAALPGRIQADVAMQVGGQDLSALNAHQLMLRGKLLRDTLSAKAMVEAREILERAVLLDPQSARAQMYLSDTYVIECMLGLGDEERAKIALLHARLAVEADNMDVFVQDHLGYAFICNQMWRDAEAQIQRTLAQIENEVESNAWCGYALLLLGDIEGAVREVTRSTTRDPMPPATFGWIRGQVFSLSGDFDRAIDELMGASRLNSLGLAFLAGAYARAGQMSEAAVALEDFIRLRHEEFATRNKGATSESVEAMARGYRIMWRRKEDWEHVVAGLVAAGLAER